MKKLWLLMSFVAVLVGCNNMKEAGMEQKIDVIYDMMTPEERVAQLLSCYMDDLFDAQGHLDTAKCRQLIPNGIGHFSQYASQKPLDPNVLRDRVAAVQQWLIMNTPSGIPALFHEEVLSGVNTRGATIYPQQIGQACSFNTELAALKTRQTSTAMRRMGGVLSLSPMVDVCRTPSFNRLEESYGEDAYLSAMMGVAFVQGLQQDDLRSGVGACSKHYLGYGGGGDADEQELMQEILMPHEAMIRQAGSKALMPGYHAMADSTGARVKCVANSHILQDILRDYLHFDGMVVSDYTAIDQLPAPKSSQLWTAVEKAALAINAGCDVDFPTGANYRHLPEALSRGLVAPEVLERAVKNVLRYKYRCGLLDDDPYLYSPDPIVLDTPEERQTAYDIATQSVVLLKNDSNLLPLTADSALRVLVTGPNANTMWAMCGDYSFPSMAYFWKKVTTDLDHPHIVTLLEGLQNHRPDSLSILYSRGCDWTEDIETKFSQLGDERAWEYELLHRKVDAGEPVDKAQALAMADSADVIIAAVGENVMLCGENRDRQGLRLPGRQEQYVEELLATGKPVVLVVFGGRAQVISAIADRCAAVLQAWYPGEEGGHAVADILYGRVSPSAKLSVSYPKTELYTPICYNYSAVQDSLVQWPFGYGLSYTTFEYRHFAVDEEAKTTDDYINLTFEVKNTGTVEATEIAQIYLSPTTASQHLRPIQLQGFARVSLAPGETKAVKAKLYTDQFGFYSHDGQRQWNILPGTFIVKVGASSTDIKMQERVTLKGDPVVKPLRDHYFSDIKIKS